MANRKVLLGVTGSIAAYKAAEIIREFQKKGFGVSVIMTENAERFITPLTLSALAQQEVYYADWKRSLDSSSMEHIDFSETHDVFLIAPATANCIAKIALGFGDDLISTTALLFHKRLIIAPAMNTQMYHHPAVQQNCSTLKDREVIFLGPIEGQLACGQEGDGHLLSPQDIVQQTIANIN